MKKTKSRDKIIIGIVIVIIILIGYYIYYRNSETYNEFEKSSNLEELIPYEEEKQEGNNIMQDLEQDKNIEETIIVHITGEVKNWGVLELPQGSRIIDAVNKAGGFTDDADVDAVNLAYALSDGIKVYIPSKKEQSIGEFAIEEYIIADSGDNVITGESKMEEYKTELVNINNATQTELETLPGIGPSTALKIISYRNENGAFSSIDDIKNVSGIGNNKFESIKDLICV